MRDAKQERARGSRGQTLRRGLFALCIAGMGLGCQGTEPAVEPASGISLSIDVVPLILPADTTQTATVWVTVLEDGLPIADSTRVSLVATLGRVTPECYTRDGLAVATYRACDETGRAAIVAQAKGERDTMAVTLY
jgi:hypothetical protein